jgi:hypothetical protein
MAYTRAWTDAVLGTNPANTIDTLLANIRQDVNERLTDLFGIVSFTADPLVAASLKLNRVANSKILGGTINTVFRDSADTVNNFSVDNDGNISARGVISGVGSGLTSLNASNISSGTLPDARFPATLPALSGLNLTSLNASNLGSGTVPDARFPVTLPAISGVNLTNLNATNIASGTLAMARFPNDPTFKGTFTVRNLADTTTRFKIDDTSGAILFGSASNVTGVSAGDAVIRNSSYIRAEQTVGNPITLIGAGGVDKRVMIGSDGNSFLVIPMSTSAGGLPSGAGNNGPQGMITIDATATAIVFYTSTGRYRVVGTAF